MFDMSALDWLLLAIGCYLAVIMLVRLMQYRREGVIQELSDQVEFEKQRILEEKKQEKRKQLREQRRQGRDVA